ncbi:MAG: IS110 family RNA-guided transposase [Ktedonobacterales bacterium]
MSACPLAARIRGRWRPAGRGGDTSTRRYGQEEVQQMVTVVGIDVAKATLAVATCDEAGAHPQTLGSVPNSVAGWEALLGTLLPDVAGGEPLVLVLEPTGGYELGLALWAHTRGWPVCLPNPRQVRDWARSQGRRAKTDGQDALLLAQYGAQVRPPRWQPLAQEVSDLEQLLRRRDDVAALLQQERARQQQAQVRPGLPAAVTGSLARVIDALEAEQAALEQAIADHLAQHASLVQARDQLLSVPGVGARTVLPLLVLLSRWQTQTGGHGGPKGLVAYVGLDPQPYQSGTSVHRRASISRQGERLLRSRLYMGALGALRGHNPVRTFYDRLVGRGKPKKVALVAAARKILVWAWAVFHSGTPFDATKTLRLAA